MQLQRFCIHWFIKGPCVGGVLLGQHLFQDGVAVFEVVTQFALLAPLLQELAIIQVLLWRFDGSASALPSGDHFAVFGVQQRSGGLASAGRDGAGGGRCGVGFPLYPLLLETNEQKQPMLRMASSGNTASILKELFTNTPAIVYNDEAITLTQVFVWWKLAQLLEMTLNKTDNRLCNNGFSRVRLQDKICSFKDLLTSISTVLAHPENRSK